MKLYAPAYYKNFKCIADRCRHSCCIGWEIDIDTDTLKKYNELKCDYAADIADSISMDDTPHFKLCEHDRCPHLDERGLCKIILNVGEDYLCGICREHPRFYNYTSVAEVGLGMSCEEAARLILNSPEYSEMIEVGEVDANDDNVEFNGRAQRGRIYEILRDRNLSYSSRLDRIYSDYSIDIKEDSVWLELIDSLEYLDGDHKELFMSYSSRLCPRGTDEYQERFLAYFIYRHCTEAVNVEDFSNRLAFCLFCERLFASLICIEHPKVLDDFASLARIISEEIEYSEDNTCKLMYLE